ncbi:MAG: class D sortase [Chloroflexi bacterium]|nr:MAG: class D sortase [Chloroflexota bacterium]
MASGLKRSPREPFSSNIQRRDTAKAGSAARAITLGGLDPLRATFLLFIAAGLILIISFFYETSLAIGDQQQMDQAWRNEVKVPVAVPPVIDPSLKRPVGGVDFAIVIPRLGYFAAVKEGVSSGVLYSGPGHYPNTPWPGDQGMVGVAAHNVYWINFPQLTPGDEIDIQTRYGNFRYRITGSRVVSPDDMTVLVPSAPGYQLTLTTCWPLWAGAFATQRYVIFADQFWPAPYKRGYT